MRRRTVALACGLAALAALGGITTLSWAAREPASAFTDGGEGASPLVADARGQGLDALRVVSGPLAVASDTRVVPERSLLVVLRPEGGYSDEEAAGLREFLERGGQALVADGFGHANTLVRPLGVTFERVRLVEQDPAQALDARLEGRKFLLRTAEPTALLLDAAANATVLAASSPRSFLDRDGDGTIDAADPQGPFPVLAEVAVGSGRLVALADPSPLLRSGAAAADNAAWRQALLAYLMPDGGTLYVDESRQPTADPVVAGLAAVGATAASPAWRWGLVACAGLILLAGLLLPAHGGEEWQPHRFRPHRFRRRATLLAPAAKDAAPEAGAPASAWTPRGVAAIAGGSALALAGLAFASPQAAWLGALLLVATGAALLPAPPRIGMQRTFAAARLPEESPLPVRLEVWSGGRGAIDVEASELLPEEFRLDAGSPWFQATLRPEPSSTSYTVSPALRGPYRLGPLRVRRTDPLRLRRHQVALPGDTVEVEPRQEPVNRIPFKTRVPRVTLGPHHVNRAGDGSEFHSLRGYQDGDPFRSINWRASARSTQLVINQRVHESRTTVTVFLDARAVSGAGPASRTPLAHGCRAALSIAAGALRVRDRVRFVVYGDGVRDIPPAPASRQLHELSRLLSGLAPAGSTPFQEAVDAVLATLSPGTPVLLASGLEGDPTLPAALGSLRARGLLVTVVASPIETAPVDKEDGGPEPDAPRIVAERAATLQALRGAGITVFEAIENVPLDYLFRVGVVA